MIALIVHGGAGNWRKDALPDAEAGCAAAAKTGYRILERGGSALDAVVAAVMVLEDDRIFNAGHGAHPNAVGDIELDAIVMDGATLSFGAVACVHRVANPIDLARRVMERTNHCFLVGDGADAFARSQGIPMVSSQALRSDTGEFAHDTVGAVALDSAGRIAAGTSTGGIRGKMPGRVGDAPVVGSGAYADSRVGGASATGHGESLLKVMMSKSTLDRLAAGSTAITAATAAVENLHRRVRGLGGVICVSRNGSVGYAYNTPRMPIAAIREGRGLVVRS